MGASLYPQHQKEVSGLERTKKLKTVLSANKVMCTVFWDAREVIWQEYLHKGTTVNAERYCEMLKNLRKAIKRKRPGLLMEGVILLQDNAHLYCSNVTSELLQQFRWDIFRHPSLFARSCSIQFCNFSSPQGRAWWEKVF